MTNQIQTELPEKDWTIMVYMAGDNNLSENMAAALDDIEQTVMGKNSDPDKNKINLLAFFDGNSLTAPTKYIDYSDVCENKLPFKHEIEERDIVYKSVDRLGKKKVSDDDLAEGNSASAYSILNFVNWCINERKKTAKNYAIIFSGHSFGFHGTSFLRDESAGGFITLFKFRWALEQIRDKILGQKISILGFDSCVMSMLEVSYELNEVAETMVASEGSLPNSGWSYAPLLRRFLPDHKEDFRQQLETAHADKSSDALVNFLLNKGININILDTIAAPAVNHKIQPSAVETPAQTDETARTDEIDVKRIMDLIVKDKSFIKEAAENFVRDLITHHNNLLIGGRSIDVAAWDLNEVVPVVKNLNLLAEKFNTCLDLSSKIAKDGQASSVDDADIEIFNELRKIILQSHYDSQTYMNEQCVDLMDFCQRFIIECKFMEKGENAQVYTDFIKLAKDVISSISRCILKSGFSGDEYQFSNGVSVFFPWSNITFSLTNFRYRYLHFCKGLNPRSINIEKPETYDGLGKHWYYFLRNYIFRVTIRQLRQVTVEKDGQPSMTVKSAFDNFSKSNPVWSRSNPVWSRSNPVWSKSNPDASRSDPPWSRSNPDASKGDFEGSRSNPDSSRGEFGNYLFYFGRFKNFEYKWNVSGFSTDFKFEEDFDTADAETPKQE